MIFAVSEAAINRTALVNQALYLYREALLVVSEAGGEGGGGPEARRGRRPGTNILEPHLSTVFLRLNQFFIEWGTAFVHIHEGKANFY